MKAFFPPILTHVFRKGIITKVSVLARVFANISMEGKIVEYINTNTKKIMLAVCLEEKGEKVRLLSPQNREVIISKNRIFHISKERIPLNHPRQHLISILKDEIEKRETLKKKINIFELWEVLCEEGGVYPLKALAELYYPSTPSSSEEAALLRALFEEKVHFKFIGNGFEVQSLKKVQEILSQKKKEEEKKKKIEEAAQWLKCIWKGESVSPPANSKEYIEILKEWCFWQEEAKSAKIAKEILEKAGLNTIEHPFLILVKLGVFSKHENIFLYRLHIPISFSKEVKIVTQALIQQSPSYFKNREDLRDLYTFTIDGPETKDFDDALSLFCEGEHYVVGIHITDLTPFVKFGDVLDEEAKVRGTSIYLPEQRIPMLPESISDQLASLKANETRPAMSFFITLDKEAKIVNYSILPSIVSVDRHFTYDEVDCILAENETFHTLYQLALKFRQRRLEQGGMIIALPELVFSFHSDTVIEIRQRNPEKPARILIAEFMIMANYLAAEFLQKKNIPALYRLQPPPRERIMNGTSKDIFTLYLQRKLLNRSQLDTKPAFHHILGLNKYTSVTSPLRRYLD
ncbi:MAG TPA: RNB domain-containing ribonuclease, partial [Candidatus Desulfofervidus auxilii]|nr:RNB domain-containing ribonuclease [Candidatus Desulfofervidus auxilii]